MFFIADWIPFRPEQVRDPALARLAALAVERWDDEWLTPGQVAVLCGVDHRDVNRYIHAGRLPGVKWGNWRIRRSDAEQVYFHKGRGAGHELDWSEKGDAFLVLARAVGFSLAAVGRLMNWPAHRVRHRLMALHRTGQIPFLIGKYSLEDVQYRREDGCLLADWRMYRGRFPTLVRAIDRFAADTLLSPVQAGCVRGVLWAWAAFHLGGQHSLTRRLQVPGGRGKRLLPIRLRALYRELQTAGVDPLLGKEQKPF